MRLCVYTTSLHIRAFVYNRYIPSLPGQNILQSLHQSHLLLSSQRRLEQNLWTPQTLRPHKELVVLRHVKHGLEEEERGKKSSPSLTWSYDSTDTTTCFKCCNSKVMLKNYWKFFYTFCHTWPQQVFPCTALMRLYMSLRHSGILCHYLNHISRFFWQRVLGEVRIHQCHSICLVHRLFQLWHLTESHRTASGFVSGALHPPQQSSIDAVEPRSTVVIMTFTPN